MCFSKCVSQNIGDFFELMEAISYGNGGDRAGNQGCCIPLGIIRNETFNSTSC